MIVECKKCHARLNVDERRVKRAGSKGRCPKCGYVVTVFPPKATTPPAEVLEEEVRDIREIPSKEVSKYKSQPPDFGRGVVEETEEEVGTILAEELEEPEGPEKEKEHRPKMLSIKWKVALYYTAFIILSFIVIFYYVNELFTKNSAAGLKKRALNIGKSFITYGTTPILGDDMKALTGLVNDLIRLDPDISYILVELPKMECIFHNFVSGLPSVLTQRLVLMPGQKDKYSYFNTTETGIYEVSLPISKNLGVVRVGISDKIIMQGLRKNQIVLVEIMAVTLVIGLILSFLFAQRLVRPLNRLADLADRISLGDLDSKVIKPKSRDEIAVLAESFSRMQTGLKIAIRRLGRKT